MICCSCQEVLESKSKVKQSTELLHEHSTTDVETRLSGASTARRRWPKRFLSRKESRRPSFSRAASRRSCCCARGRCVSRHLRPQQRQCSARPHREGATWRNGWRVVPSSGSRARGSYERDCGERGGRRRAEDQTEASPHGEVAPAPERPRRESERAALDSVQAQTNQAITYVTDRLRGCMP